MDARRPSGRVQHRELPEVGHRGARVPQFGAQPREEVLQELRAPGQERVRVTALRGAAAVLRCGGEVVLLQDDHLVETVGEDAGGDEAGVAAADDEGALVPLRRHGRHAG
ncbi:hypothetical protein SMD44_00689 [Streptomyces alboflavus]|uniref:Uncharacterized protein n=1 Tax=Streptomyces alboflavus TaxID=67267 RepID=A0A1Z1W4E1_9ACTN|nr:hypothetical protein [Streptomyces alboflavus]ARX81291.1 hypothetical protein SMD44_00689 [Streptomyces alboflavus]